MAGAARDAASGAVNVAQGRAVNARRRMDAPPFVSLGPAFHAGSRAASGVLGSGHETVRRCREWRRCSRPIRRPSAPGCWRCARWCSTSPPRTPAWARLTETLKWGQPSYLTAESGSGTTVRIDRLKGRDDGYAVYFHCQSGLVETFREHLSRHFAYEGKRAIVFEAKDACQSARSAIASGSRSRIISGAKDWERTTWPAG